MDRYDLGEFAGLAGLVGFAAIIWPPAALLVASLALLVEVNMRSRGEAPVRARGTGRLGRTIKAVRAAWADDDGKAKAA